MSGKPTDGSDGSPPNDPMDRPKRRAPPLPPRPEIYEKWWEAYRGGARSPEILARAVKASIHTIRHAIRHGWPGANLPALSERARLWDKQLGKAIQEKVKKRDEQTAVAISTMVTERWEEMARRILGSMDRTSDALAVLGAKILDAARDANFVKYVEVPDFDEAGKIRTGTDGKPLTTLKAMVDGPAVAAALRLYMSASKDHAAISKAVFGSLEPPDAGGRTFTDLPALSAEQLERIRNGEIPEDISEEQLAAAMLEAKRLTSAPDS